MVSYTRDAATLCIYPDRIELTSGLDTVSLEIPVSDFKQKLYYTYTSGEPTSYGLGENSLKIIKITDRYPKVRIYLYSSEGANGYINAFQNDLVWLAIKLREVHQESEEWFICDDQIKVERSNGSIKLTDRRINYQSELLPEEAEKLWGVMLMRTFGVLMDGIFGDVALLGNTLKFPFTVRKKRTVNPLTLKDTAKLLAIL